MGSELLHGLAAAVFAGSIAGRHRLRERPNTGRPDRSTIRIGAIPAQARIVNIPKKKAEALRFHPTLGAE
jgi:hypothetical protein